MKINVLDDLEEEKKRGGGPRQKAEEGKRKVRSKNLENTYTLVWKQQAMVKVTGGKYDDKGNSKSLLLYLLSGTRWLFKVRRKTCGKDANPCIERGKQI